MKKHKFSQTVVTHHGDGSHTVKHHHEDGKSHKEYARPDHDGMMDGMMEHLSEPNAGEEQDEHAQPLEQQPQRIMAQAASGAKQLGG